MSDRVYAAALEGQIKAKAWTASGSPSDWAMESHALAKAALLPARGDANEAYYRKYAGAMDERLALGGLRLAAVINRSLP
jgi:hypothetical protein